jgi:hypothetical protein
MKKISMGELLILHDIPRGNLNKEEHIYRVLFSNLPMISFPPLRCKTP